MLWIDADAWASEFMSATGTIELPGGLGDFDIEIRPGTPAPEYVPPVFTENVTGVMGFDWRWIALIAGAVAVIVLTR